MWTNAMFEALGWAFWPSPPAPLPKWERGDSGARVWHPIAVHSYYEHLFCPPLNPRTRGSSPPRTRGLGRLAGDQGGAGEGPGVRAKTLIVTPQTPKSPICSVRP
jgi:hypothetical protein